MNPTIIQSNLFIWSITLAVGFPFLIIVLGEIIHRLKRRGKPLATTLQVVRNLVLPVLVFMLFMQYVLKLDPNSNLIRTVQTLLWVFVIHAALSLLNVILFEQAEADTWRARFPKLLIDLSRLFLILVGTAIALSSVWNADLAGLATALGVSSIVIALALQDTLGSIMFRDRFMTRIWYAAQRNNLKIPFPIRTLYHTRGSNSRLEDPSKKFAETLQSIPVFVPLKKEQTNLDNLSQGVMLHHFGTGEKVIQQGYPGNDLYIIISGKALLTTPDAWGTECEVLSLKAGEFFGEMALFSGEPSTVSVTAIEDLEVMIFSSIVVNQMIERQPSFAREIGQILEVRRKAIQAVKQSSV